MQSGNKNLSRGKSEIISETKCRDRGKKFRKKKLTTNSAMPRENGNCAIGKHGAFVGIPFSEVPEGGGGPLIDGRLVYTV